MDCNEQGAAPSNHSNLSSKRRFFCWALGGVAILLVGWMVGRLIVDNHTETASSSPIPGEDVASSTPSADNEELLQVSRRRLTEELQAHLVSFRTEVEEKYNSFLQALPPYDAKQAFAEVREGVDWIASREGFCGWRVCVNFAYKMGYDKVKGTRKFEESISSYVEDRLIAPMGRAWNAYVSAYERYCSDLENLSSKFSEDCALSRRCFLHAVGRHSPVNVELIGVTGQEPYSIEACILKSVSESSRVARSALAEVDLIRNVNQNLISEIKKTVTESLAESIEKFSTSCSMTAELVTVDGPLPIGDMLLLCAPFLSIQGQTVSVYDVYRATKSMPEQLHSGLMKEVRSAEDQMSSLVLENAKDVFTAVHNAAGGELVKIQRGTFQRQ